jgi:hypothetical protein
MIWNKTTSKWQDKQKNEHLGISFIYHWYSFLLWDALSNVQYGHAVNFHHEWCMAYISGAGVSLTHIQTPWSRTIPNLFHIENIHKQKITISTQIREVQCWKLSPWWHGLANFQLTTCKHNINIREPQCKKLKARKVKYAIRFVRALLINFRITPKKV